MGNDGRMSADGGTPDDGAGSARGADDPGNTKAGTPSVPSPRAKEPRSDVLSEDEERGRLQWKTILSGVVLFFGGIYLIPIWESHGKFSPLTLIMFGLVLVVWGIYVSIRNFIRYDR